MQKTDTEYKVEAKRRLKVKMLPEITTAPQMKGQQFSSILLKLDTRIVKSVFVHLNQEPINN